MGVMAAGSVQQSVLETSASGKFREAVEYVSSRSQKHIVPTLFLICDAAASATDAGVIVMVVGLAPVMMPETSAREKYQAAADHAYFLLMNTILVILTLRQPETASTTNAGVAAMEATSVQDRQQEEFVRQTR